MNMTKNITIPIRCQVCGTRITNLFIDGATRGGRWAYMCRTCHIEEGVGLGIGRGQRYVKQQDNQWVKTNK